MKLMFLLVASTTDMTTTSVEYAMSIKNMT